MSNTHFFMIVEGPLKFLSMVNTHLIRVLKTKLEYSCLIDFIIDH